MKNTLPFISVVVPTYNSASTVLATLNSIRNQTYEGQIELIVSDDNSSDTTVEVVNKWLSENKNYFQHAQLLQTSTNTGVVGNLNRACKEAKGDWIKTIAGDDLLTDSALSDFVSFVNNSAEHVDFVASSVKTFGDDVELTDVEKLPIMYGSCNHMVDLDFVYENPTFWFPGPSFFIRRSTLSSIGYYPDVVRNVEDAPLLYSLLANGYKLYYLDKPTVYYRWHRNSITQSEGPVKMAEYRNTAFDAILLPTFDKYRQLDLKLYFLPSKYMVRHKNKRKVRYEILKAISKLARCAYRLLFSSALKQAKRRQ